MSEPQPGATYDQLNRARWSRIRRQWPRQYHDGKRLWLLVDDEHNPKRRIWRVMKPKQRGSRR
jgi:hypothetical protein